MTEPAQSALTQQSPGPAVHGEHPDTRTLSALLQQVMALSRPDQIRLTRYMEDLPDLEQALRHNEQRPALLRRDDEDDAALIIGNLSRRWGDEITASATVRNMQAFLSGASVPRTAEPAENLKLGDSAAVQTPEELTSPATPANEPQVGGGKVANSARSGEVQIKAQPGTVGTRSAWQENSRARLSALLTNGVDLNVLYEGITAANDSGRHISKSMVRKTAKKELKAHLPDACYHYIWSVELPQEATPDHLNDMIGKARRVYTQHGVTPAAVAELIATCMQDPANSPDEPSNDDRTHAFGEFSKYRNAGHLDETDLQMLLEGMIEYPELNFDPLAETLSVELILNNTVLAATGLHLNRLVELGYSPEDLDAPLRQLGWAGPPLKEYAALQPRDLQALIELFQKIVTPKPEQNDQNTKAQNVLIEDTHARVSYIDDILDRNGSIVTNQITRVFGIRSGTANQYLQDLGLIAISDGRYRRPRS